MPSPTRSPHAPTRGTGQRAFALRAARCSTFGASSTTFVASPTTFGAAAWRPCAGPFSSRRPSGGSTAEGAGGVIASAADVLESSEVAVEHLTRFGEQRRLRERFVDERDARLEP